MAGQKLARTVPWITASQLWLQRPLVDILHTSKQISFTAGREALFLGRQYFLHSFVDQRKGGIHPGFRRRNFGLLALLGSNSYHTNSLLLSVAIGRPGSSMGGGFCCVQTGLALVIFLARVRLGQQARKGAGGAEETCLAAECHVSFDRQGVLWS